MSSKAALTVFVLTAVTVMSLIVAFPMMFAGYFPRVEWNKSLQSTTCSISGYSAVKSRCSYSCNCVNRCTSKPMGGSSCSLSCSVCFKDCYKSSIYFNYTIFEPSMSVLQTVRPYGSANTENEALAAVKRAYPLGASWKCWYNYNNHAEVLDSLFEPMVFFILSIIAFSVAGLAVLGVLGIVGLGACFRAYEASTMALPKAIVYFETPFSSPTPGDANV